MTSRPRQRPEQPIRGRPSGQGSSDLVSVPHIGAPEIPSPRSHSQGGAQTLPSNTFATDAKLGLGALLPFGRDARPAGQLNRLAFFVLAGSFDLTVFHVC